MNRGVGKMGLFEGPGDMERLFERLERVVTDRLVEVHAAAVMGNHFHLLVRSPAQELSLALQRIQGPYAQYFNRRRERDGPLYRARFKSIPVRSYAYRCLLVSYIDWNPVCAGLATIPREYEYGSARHYARFGAPPWLDRSWVEREVCARAGIRKYSPAAYSATLGARPTPGQQRLVGLREASPGEDDELDDVLSAPGSRLRTWLLARARRPERRVAVVDEESIASVTVNHDSGSRSHPDARPTRDTALVGMLRTLAGLTHHDIVRRTGMSRDTVGRLVRAHADLLERDVSYAARVIELATSALVLCHPPSRRR
jgi:REP element-mobilizing transposase RayT